jgi:hypothetical protein
MKILATLGIATALLVAVAVPPALSGGNNQGGNNNNQGGNNQGGLHGAPGPLIGAGVPALLATAGAGALFLWRRRR